MAKPSKRSPERKLQVVLSVLRGEVSVAAGATTVGEWLSDAPATSETIEASHSERR